MTAESGESPSIEELIERRLSRRQALGGLTAGAILAGLSPTATGAEPTSLSFAEVAHGYDDNIACPPGYDAQVLIRWGDPITPGAPAFEFERQSVAAQEQQAGYNNDFIGYVPLPLGSNNSDHGLLCVNFEYTDPSLMFAGVEEKDKLATLTREQVEIEMAAHGHGVIEIRKDGGQWKIVANSKYNRRISALSTEFQISGPAAGDARLQTKEDPTGTRVVGTLNNCAGGITPWGTVLFAEENFHQYFAGDPSRTKESRNHRQYGLGGPDYGWYRYFDRFDIEKSPHEPNRFGWVAEVDPYDPKSVPVKRTALGRMKHEGAACVLDRDQHVVVYQGDDERFQYIYRFVSAQAYNADQREANRNLLDKGTLSVARLTYDGQVLWMPLVHGQGPLTEANGFNSQADVLIETRRAATLLGATPMDRPEDVEANPATGEVFVCLTNNTKRTADQTDTANPRPSNAHGHIIKLIPPSENGKPHHGAKSFRWEIFLLAGHTDKGGKYHPATSQHGWLSCPDNCAFDPQGRIWIATDGAPKATRSGSGSPTVADGVYAADTTGPGQALTRRFFRAPAGAEVCGPAFTPDGQTFFLSIQHPGEGSTLKSPSTRWPDFDPQLPPRPAVVAITRPEGKFGT